MSNNYGAVGISPLQPMLSSPEELLANLLSNNYDQTLTGIPFSDISYKMWYSGYGDIAIYFQDAGTVEITKSVDHDIQDIDHYTDIHIFVRSNKIDYVNSAEKKCFDIEKWIIKTINQRKGDLASQGIQYIEYENTRALPYFMGDETNYDNLIYRKVISVVMKIRLINNA